MTEFNADFFNSPAFVMQSLEKQVDSKWIIQTWEHQGLDSKCGTRLIAAAETLNRAMSFEEPFRSRAKELAGKLWEISKEVPLDERERALFNEQRAVFRRLTGAVDDASREVFDKDKRDEEKRKTQSGA